MEVGVCFVNKTGRNEDKASQIIKMNPNVATKEMAEPMEDTTFHPIKASG